MLTTPFIEPGYRKSGDVGKTSMFKFPASDFSPTEPIPNEGRLASAPNVSALRVAIQFRVQVLCLWRCGCFAFQYLWRLNRSPIHGLIRGIVRPHGGAPQVHSGKQATRTLDGRTEVPVRVRV